TEVCCLIERASAGKQRCASLAIFQPETSPPRRFCQQIGSVRDSLSLPGVLRLPAEADRHSRAMCIIPSRMLGIHIAYYLNVLNSKRKDGNYGSLLRLGEALGKGVIALGGDECESRHGDGA